MIDVTVARGFDFHCHIDLYPDPAKMVAACEKERIVTLAVTTTPRAWPQNKAWAASGKYVNVAAGLHPELVAQRHGETALLLECMKASRFVGEIGLDGSQPHRASLSRQKEVFGRVLDTASTLGGRVLSVHSRGAATEVIELIRAKTSASQVLPILHWYAGSVTAMRLAIGHGCYFSVNGNMLDGERGQAIVTMIPDDRLLTETDGPFTGEGDRPREPVDVVGITKRLSLLRNVPEDELRATIATNARAILRFAGEQ
ncbi:Qat anti-phage system TatD family nuclease QatD [Sinorhizobium medicae]|uniref:Qat anti-phage system TatD family nuclease QatD n=1 Tax=Sinorhizobium medicae TaxID=110321 RepID=UPI002B1BDC09|nr:Qat anti-phage system TatD family nuclease QatD [Sinorhizobium medicae]WQO45911.1 Qat anti-phage system TatD family nuclease QatD [Sinorhizobium medicae]